MNLVRFYNPYYNVNRNLVDELFSNMFRNDQYDSNVAHCGCQPANNILETETDFKIELLVPGLTKEDVQINVLKNTLTVKAGKKGNGDGEKNQEQVKYAHREFGQVDFEKQYKLPNTVDADKIGAKFENGILTITLPKKTEEVEKNPVEIAIA